MNHKPWSVHKFGGASLAGPAEYRQVADILLADDSGRQAAIVSASFGITDRLVKLIEENSEIGVRFTEPMDPASALPFDTFMTLRGAAGAAPALRSRAAQDHDGRRGGRAPVGARSRNPARARSEPQFAGS